MKNKNPKLDQVDRKIMATLQANGRMSNVDLSEKVGLSPTPCLERVRRLEAAGYITGYSARLNADKLGFNILAFIEVSLIKTNPDAFDDFRRAVATIDEIQECHMVAGGFDYLLKVRVSNMTAYRHFLGEKISSLPGVDRTHTYMVMEEVKESDALAI
jgi:Lrp/AsnC family leucine-responsive transcriptional regulator